MFLELPKEHVYSISSRLEHFCDGRFLSRLWTQPRAGATAPSRVQLGQGVGPSKHKGISGILLGKIFMYWNTSSKNDFHPRHASEKLFGIVFRTCKFNFRPIGPHLTAISRNQFSADPHFLDPGWTRVWTRPGPGPTGPGRVQIRVQDQGLV